MNTDIIKKESKKLTTYALVGVFTTGLTWFLWTLFIIFGKAISQNDSPIWVSFSQFIASFLVIGVSLYLNRKITFKESKRRHEKRSTTIIHFYLIYGFGAFVASLITLLLQKNVGFLNLEIIKLLGIVINVGINYLGQRFWVFKD